MIDYIGPFVGVSLLLAAVSAGVIVMVWNLWEEWKQ